MWTNLLLLSFPHILVSILIAPTHCITGEICAGCNRLFWNKHYYRRIMLTLLKLNWHVQSFFFTFCPTSISSDLFRSRGERRQQREGACEYRTTSIMKESRGCDTGKREQTYPQKLRRKRFLNTSHQFPNKAVCETSFVLSFLHAPRGFFTVRRRQPCGVKDYKSWEFSVCTFKPSWHCKCGR